MHDLYIVNPGLFFCLW